MTFDPALAAIRFGTGLSPALAPPVSVGDMLDRLSGPDDAAARWPIPGYDAARPSRLDSRDLSRARRNAVGTPQEAEAEAAFQAGRLAIRTAKARFLGSVVARHAGTADGLRERLVAFWADHFTVRARNNDGEHLVTPFVESVIRPHVAGRFADMLRAATLHPETLIYLDQIRSMGPNSAAAARRDRGLNENLARELLELHTVGVDGPYDQADVRELAELLTGLVWNHEDGVHFRADHAEPGGETVLGVTYPAVADLSVIEGLLDDLALHPATAAHLARKLAVHFVSDTPDEALVEAIATRFTETGGDLFAVTQTMLAHPAAWVPDLHKAKPPTAFLTSAFRALGVPPDWIVAQDDRMLRRILGNPLALMGQPWEDPIGPDGWPEEAEAWVTPQGLAGRIGWAMRIPRQILDPLPDPRGFVDVALGSLADELTRFAAEAAETRHEGVGIVLASARFNRR
jgi:uncharacterized protein (DUF1800 family)